MYKIVLDADGLIKLVKSGLMEKISNNVSCSITTEVYDETVRSGKERLYEDAYVIEDLIEKGRIKVVPMKAKGNEFGKGETSTLEAYKKWKFSAIISDDKRFLSMMENENVHFIIPSDMIAILSTTNKISKQEAVEGLNKIKSFIRDDNYKEALKRIGGKI